MEKAKGSFEAVILSDIWQFGTAWSVKCQFDVRVSRFRTMLAATPSNNSQIG